MDARSEIPERTLEKVHPELVERTEVARQQDFMVDARAAVQGVRLALSAAFGSLGADPTQARPLARHLGLDKGLAWKVSRIVIDDDPIAAIPLLPARAGQRALLDSLKRADVPLRIVENVRESLAEFESMVATHAGDRETFVMMLSELTDHGRAERDEGHRKLAFLGNSATLGVQARVRLTTHVITPGDDANFVDVATVSGLVDFRRLRSNEPWTMASFGLANNDGSSVTTRTLIPLDPRVPESGAAPLLLDYCSQNLPKMQENPGPAGTMLLQALDGPVGNTGLFTCLTGIRAIGMLPRWWQAPNPQDSEFIVMLATPAETLLFDLFVHESLAPALNPSIISYGALPGDSLLLSGEPKRRMLPLAEKIIHLGAKPPDLTAFEMPVYPEMMEWVFRRTGHDASEFHGFRFRQRYPWIPSKIAYRYYLPEKQRPGTDKTS